MLQKIEVLIFFLLAIFAAAIFPDSPLGTVVMIYVGCRMIAEAISGAKEK